MKGKKQSPETIEKRVSQFRGKKKPPFTETHIKNLSISHLGQKSWNKDKTGVYTEESLKLMSDNSKNQIVTEETRQKIREKIIKRIKNQTGQNFPCYNPKACKLFEQLNKKFGLNIRHAENGWEVQICGYFPDAIDFGNCLIIEFDEKYHINQKRKLKDEIRQSNLIKETGFTFVKIKKGDIIE